MVRWLIRQINVWVILVAVAVAGGLIALLVALVFFLPVPATQTVGAAAAMTVIAAPTITPSPLPSYGTATPSPAPVVDGITVGSYVQINGTDGQGLRLRSGPGTSNPPRFLGMDTEVFQVKDGPKTSDGFTWWLLEAPYDPSRTGWAASQYLMLVNPTAGPAAGATATATP